MEGEKAWLGKTPNLAEAAFDDRSGDASNRCGIADGQRRSRLTGCQDTAYSNDLRVPIHYFCTITHPASRPINIVA